MNESEPKYLNPGEWHIPFGDKMDIDKLIQETGYLISPLIDENKISLQQLKVSVARCARISYNNFDTDNIDYKKDLELYDRLISDKPAHMSPAEHQARVPTERELDYFSSRYLTHLVGKCEYHRGKYISNLNGWIQYRKIIEDECINRK